MLNVNPQKNNKDIIIIKHNNKYILVCILHVYLISGCYINNSDPGRLNVC